MRILLIKMTTSEQVYKLAAMGEELLSCRILIDFGHMMRNPQDGIEVSVTMGLVEWVRRRRGRLV